MNTETKTLNVQQDTLTEPATERTRESRVFIPRTDIFETEDKITLLMDMPGVDPNNIDIKLEENVLKINGYANIEEPEGYSLMHAEYEMGDYERTFRLSDKIDMEKIEATFINGTLKLILPKAKSALPQKIEIKIR